MEDAATLRDVIKSARFQFSPSTQTVKQAAIDRIVEQCIGLSPTRGVAAEEILHLSRIGTDGVTVLRMQDINEAITRLRAAMKVALTETPDGPRYALTKKARREFANLQRESEKRAVRVVARLFANRAPKPELLVAPFFEVLGRIFSKLSEIYVRVLKRDMPAERFLKAGEISEAVATVEAAYHIDQSVGLSRAVADFFQNEDPESVAIKWNLAQNYYISLSLGLDPGGELLTKELFGASTLFLDTNVIIHGVEPTARHHNTFHALVDACSNLNIRLSVWIETLKELDRVVTYQMREVPRIGPHIPRETAPKVRSIFFQLYREALKSKGESSAQDMNNLFANFINAREVLEGEYSVQVDWDEATERDHTERTIVSTVERMMQYYRERRRHPKGRLSAMHDVLLLRKVSSGCAPDARSMVVTLDTLLPGFALEGQDPSHCSAVTLDAFLHWISPFVTSPKVQRDFAVLFTDALKYHVFPQETFFDLSDFLIFEEMDWDTRELPASDVEECVRYLRKAAPSLNPGNPVDREKLHAAVSKFFADPARKYKENLARLESEVTEANKAVGAERDGHEVELQEREAQIAQLREELAKERRQRLQERVRRSARRRLAAVGAFCLALMGLVVVCANKWGTGNSLYQKILEAWPYFIAALGFSGASSFVVLGKERMKALGWGIRKALRRE